MIKFDEKRNTHLKVARWEKTLKQYWKEIDSSRTWWERYSWNINKFFSVYIYKYGRTILIAATFLLSKFVVSIMQNSE